MIYENTERKILEQCRVAQANGYTMQRGALLRGKACCALGAFVAGEAIPEADLYEEAAKRAGLNLSEAWGLHRGFDGKELGSGAPIKCRKAYDMGQRIALEVLP